MKLYKSKVNCSEEAKVGTSLLDKTINSLPFELHLPTVTFFFLLLSQSVKLNIVYYLLLVPILRTRNKIKRTT